MLLLFFPLYSRFSLQTANQNSDKHLYENREQVQVMHGRHDSSDLTVPHNSRRASFDDGTFKMESNDARHSMPVHKAEEDKMYQNVHPGKNTVQNGGSPTKRNHLPSLNLPVGYYNLTPPSLVRKSHSNYDSPSTSPEEGTLPEQTRSNPTLEAVTDHTNHEYPELSMAVVGDSLIVNKSAKQRPKALSPPSEAGDSGGVYQNLEFMRGPTGDQTPKRYL